RHGPSSGRWKRSTAASPTSSCSSSTRLLRPWGWRRCPTSASRTTSSTSTAAPSPWAIPSACPEPGSCSPSSMSCAAAGAASALRPYAVAAAKATPPSSALSSGVNQAHLDFLGSAEWAEMLKADVLPWIEAASDLGDDVLEVGPGPGLTTDLLRERVQ